MTSGFERGLEHCMKSITTDILQPFPSQTVFEVRIRGRGRRDSGPVCALGGNPPFWFPCLWDTRLAPWPTKEPRSKCVKNHIWLVRVTGRRLRRSSVMAAGEVGTED